MILHGFSRYKIKKPGTLFLKDTRLSFLVQRSKHDRTRRLKGVLRGKPKIILIVIEHIEYLFRGFDNFIITQAY